MLYMILLCLQYWQLVKKQLDIMSSKLSVFYILSSALLGAGDYLDAVNINIYPEYYYSGVMVEMEAIVVSETDSPKISITLPAESDSVFLVEGIPGPDSEVLPLQIETGDPFKSVVFEISKDQFRLFVFYNPFDSGNERNLQWPVSANVEMKNVHTALQVPVMAENFSLSKEVSSEEEDQHGIQFKIVHVGDIPAFNMEIVAVSYLNNSGMTSMENLRGQLDQTQTENQPQIIEQAKPKRYKLLLWEPLVILGVLFSIIGVMYYQKSKSEQNSDKNICPSCKNHVQLHDQYCAKCGAKIS